MSILGTKSDAAVANGIDTLNASLATIIQKATTGVEAGVNFLSDQIPDVIHQLLMWKLTENLFLVGISLLIFIVYGYGLKKAHQHDAFDRWGWPVAFVGGIASFVAVFFFIICSLEALKIMIAPKIYLIEYATHLLKGN